MGRTFSEKKLVIASHNQGKLREIRDLIGPLGIEVVSAGELGLPDGDPGIYSARWAGPEKDFAQAMQKVEDGLQKQAAAGNNDRSAAFVCALTICWPDGHTESVEGRVHGDLVWPPRGTNGFGYDPMFVPEGHDKTFGEVDAGWKHSISHRAVAFEKLLKRVGLDQAANGAGDNAG